MSKEQSKPEIKPRPEEERLAQAPIEVMLGGEIYQISPLVIRDSRPWRKRVIALLAPLPAMVEATMDVSNPDAFGSVLTQMMVTMPDQVLDLFFDYATALDRDKIEDTANDAEIATAFSAIIKVAFPLAQSLPKAMAHLSR